MPVLKQHNARPVIKDAVVLSLREFAALGGTRAMLDLYQLLGDPALQRKGF